MVESATVTTSALNILHVTPCFEPAWAYGDVAGEVAALARAQVAMGHRVSILTTDALAPHERLPSGESHLDGIRVIRVPNISGAARTWLNVSTPIGMRRSARALFSREKIAVVHLHELRTVENLRVAGVVPRDAGLVVSPHGTLRRDVDRRSGSRAWDWAIGDRLLAHVQQFIACSDIEAHQIRALYDRRGLPLGDDQVAIVPTGVDLSAFETVPDRSASMTRFNLAAGPVVLFFGRLSKGAGLDVLLSAFALVRNDLRDAQLMIAGPDHGALSGARAQVAALGLEACVRFPGYLTGTEALAAFAVADLFAQPAAGDGFPGAPLDALAAGVPVLLGPDSRFHEAADAGAGRIVALSAGPWADAMRSVLQDASSLVAFRRRARTVAEGYTWRAVAAGVQAVYERARPGTRSEN